LKLCRDVEVPVQGSITCRKTVIAAASVSLEQLTGSILAQLRNKESGMSTTNFVVGVLDTYEQAWQFGVSERE
jgi:hypothetical protein